MTRSRQSKREARAPDDAPQRDAANTADVENDGPARLAAGLYLAATPIGAADDVTLRALDVLARADVIAAEDTRRAQKLMNLHGVARRGRPMIPYHDHNGAAQRPGLLRRIAEGESVVCVTDAGTPLVADPGWRLAREAIDAGLNVNALPGASALLAALTVSGLPTDRFFFAGFPPPKQAARRAALSELAAVPGTLVFYESPRRLGALLADIEDVLGGDRMASVSRELTKLYEETRRGAVAELAMDYRDAAPKGEIVVCVGPRNTSGPDAADLDVALNEALKDAGVRDAAKLVSLRLGLPKRAVYARALELAERPGSDD